MLSNPLTLEEIYEITFNQSNVYPRRRFLVTPEEGDGVAGWYDISTYIQTLINEGDIVTDPAGTTWIDLVTGYNATPTLFATIVSGDVYLYTYNPAITYYRHIATDLSEDAFYDNFDGVNLTDLIVAKELT